MILSFLMFTCFAETAAELEAKEAAEMKIFMEHQAASAKILSEMKLSEVEVDRLGKEVADKHATFQAKEKHLQAIEENIEGQRKNASTLTVAIQQQEQAAARAKADLERAQQAHSTAQNSHAAAKTKLQGHKDVHTALKTKKMDALAALHGHH